MLLNDHLANEFAAALLSTNTTGDSYTLPWVCPSAAQLAQSDATSTRGGFDTVALASSAAPVASGSALEVALPFTLAAAASLTLLLAATAGLGALMLSPSRLRSLEATGGCAGAFAIAGGGGFDAVGAGG